MPSAGTAVAAGAGAAAIGAAAAGGMAMTDSTSSAGDPTPSATPPASDSAKQNPLETPASAEPPPPPESRQFTPTNLPIGGGVVGQNGGAESDAGSSTKVVPPASRAGGVETPVEAASTSTPLSGNDRSIPGAFSPEQQESEREIVPGAFPDDELQPTTLAEEVVPSNAESTQATPAPQAKASDDFDSAFANFGQGEKVEGADTSEDPFAPSSSQPGPPQAGGSSSEFPPIQSLEQEDESDSDNDDSEDDGFEDNFTPASTQQNGVSGASTSLSPDMARVASGDDMASARPTMTSVESTASDLPTFAKGDAPPTYEQSDDITHGGSGEHTGSNQFPPEFGDLLPSREDPTSPPPPDAVQTPTADEITSTPLPTDSQNAQNLAAPQGGPEPVATPGTDIFVDASSRPTSSVPESAFASMTQTAGAPPPEAPKNAFDEFDDFDDLSEAKEADKTGSDDFGFGRKSQDEFNPAFDSPAVSSTPTPMRSVQQSQESNGFADFTPNVSTNTTDPFASGGGSESIQQTPQNVQHDWDAIFSGLDSSKDVDPSFGNAGDPWSTTGTTTNGNSAATTATSPPSTGVAKVAMPELGRAVTPGDEHDDPILKRLTGMGYPRSDALNALEMYDYDINKVSSSLSRRVTFC